MKLAEYKGMQGIWIKKKWMGVPFFIEKSRIDMYLIKKIEAGYYELIQAPKWSK